MGIFSSVCGVSFKNKKPSAEPNIEAIITIIIMINTTPPLAESHKPMFLTPFYYFFA